MAQGILTFSDSGGAYVAKEVPGALPYQVVAFGPPAIVTTVGPGLEVATWALADEAHEYRGMIPLVVEPPLIALAPVVLPYDSNVGALTLLAANGEAAWTSEHSELLWPEHTYAEPGVAYVVTTGGGDPLFPFGEQVGLVSVDASTGHVIWSQDLDAAFATAGVQLWALTEHWGLLSLQYGYESYEFISFSRKDGSLGLRRMLEGQPATSLVYPGPVEEPFEIKVDGEAIGLRVFLNEGISQWWAFDLAGGELARSGSAPPGAILREENDRAPGGSSVPGPDDPPFPQRMLPAAAGPSWTIPALVDGQGRVLVIGDDGAHWVSFLE